MASSPKVYFIGTNNVKFGISFCLEKAISLVSGPTNGRGVELCFGGGEEVAIARLAEIGWLRKLSGCSDRGLSLLSDSIDLLKFKFDCSPAGGQEQVRFFLFPSFEGPGGYIRWLIECSKTDASLLVIVDFEKVLNGPARSFLPPQSIIRVLEHAASRQFEMQREWDRGLIENAAFIPDSGDRLRFSGTFLL